MALRIVLSLNLRRHRVRHRGQRRRGVLLTRMKSRLDEAYGLQRGKRYYWWTRRLDSLHETRGNGCWRRRCVYRQAVSGLEGRARLHNRKLYAIEGLARLGIHELLLLLAAGGRRHRDIGCRRCVAALVLRRHRDVRRYRAIESCSNERPRHLQIFLRLRSSRRV